MPGTRGRPRKYADYQRGILMSSPEESNARVEDGTVGVPSPFLPQNQSKDEAGEDGVHYGQHIPGTTGGRADEEINWNESFFFIFGYFERTETSTLVICRICKKEKLKKGEVLKVVAPYENDQPHGVVRRTGLTSARMDTHIRSSHFPLYIKMQYNKEYAALRKDAFRGKKTNLSTKHNSRPYSCELCSTSFSTDDRLTRHKRTHSEERICICPFCGKGFKKSEKMYRHKISCHMNPNRQSEKIDNSDSSPAEHETENGKDAWSSYISVSEETEEENDNTMFQIRSKSTENQLLLAADSHQMNVMQSLRELLQNNILTDVTLVTDDRVKIEAHKIILCASSSGFRDCLAESSRSHTMMFLRGISSQILSPLLDYIYFGETKVPQRLVAEFMKTAKDLGVTGLTQEEQTTLKTENIVEDNTVVSVEEAVKEVALNELSDTEYTDNLQGMNNECSKYRERQQDLKYHCNYCKYSSDSKDAVKDHLRCKHNVDLFIFNEPGQNVILKQS